MATDSMQQLRETLENLFVAPTSSYLTALTDHMEAVATLQIDAVKAYTDIAFNDIRAALSIHDAEDFSNYVRNQPQYAKAFSDRLQSDAERLVTANQTFMESANQVTQASVGTIEKVAQEGVARVQKATTAS